MPAPQNSSPQQAPGRNQKAAKGSSNLLSIIVFMAIMLFIIYQLMTCSASEATYYGDEAFYPTWQEGQPNYISSSGLMGSQSSSTTAAQEGQSIQIKGLRDHYVDTANAKTATVLVYMCGADLETYSKAASKDIQEMCKAQLGDNVKVVIQTGGAKKWHFTNKANPKTRQRWMIDGNGMYLVGDAGKGTMLDPQSVTDFANWGIKNYPADRYIFVFWDHGGGTIGGYGHDEMYANADPLTLLELRQSLAATGQKFDLVGFDACLMGTIETAYAMEPVADYLLASEEYEMGDGWMWTGFLSALGKDPSIDTVELGKVAIDDFTDYYFAQRLTAVTLSLVDLREVPYVYEEMGDFLAAAESSIESDNRRFAEMSKARTQARSFADGGMDQVDVADLIQRTSFDGKEDLLAAVNSCVKYRSGTSITGANGLAMYFPYSEMRQYNGTRSILNGIGYVRPTEFYDYFLSVMGSSGAGSYTGSSYGYGSGGSGYSSDSSDFATLLFQQLLGAYSTQGSAASSSSSSNAYADQSYSAESWFQSQLGQFDYQQLPSHLDMSYDDGAYVIPMTNQLWNAFSSFHTTVMEEHGDGYIMLGRDDVYDQIDNDIAVFYNNEWLTLGGKAVSYYSAEPSQEANGEYSHSGSIPALLNGKTNIEIVVYFPPESQQSGTYTGYVQGYRENDADALTYGRGLQQFTKGDVVTPVFDYYDGNGNYSGTIKGGNITLNSSKDLEVTYELYDHNTVHFWGTLITIYGDQINTDVVEQ